MKVFDTGNQFGIGRFLKSIVGASNNKKFIIKGFFSRVRMRAVGQYGGLSAC